MSDPGHYQVFKVSENLCHRLSVLRCPGWQRIVSGTRTQWRAHWQRAQARAIVRCPICCTMSPVAKIRIVHGITLLL
jgi:hypothetical protein